MIARCSTSINSSFLDWNKPQRTLFENLWQERKVVVGGFSLAVVVGDIIDGRYCNGFIFDNVV